MSKAYKIGLIGTPGSGRTTVAFEVSENLKIPFLPSRAITKSILDRDGYCLNSRMYVEQFLCKKEREIELINSKIKIEKDAKTFITDRTTLEQFAYVLLNTEQYSDDEISKIQEKCKKHLATYTHIFYFKRAGEIRKNGIRTTNIFFQMKMDFIIRGLLEEWGVKHIQCPSDSKYILKHLSENS